MIERIENLAVDDRTDRIKVLDHSARRTARLERPTQGDLEPVRVAMRPGTLAEMVRENVRRLEPEKLTNLHDSQSSRSAIP